MSDEDLDLLWRSHAGRLLHIAALTSDWRTRYLAESIDGPEDPEANRLGRSILASVEELEDAIERTLAVRDRVIWEAELEAAGEAG